MRAKKSAKWGAKRIQKHAFPEIPLSTIHYTLRQEAKRCHGVSITRSGVPRSLQKRTETVCTMQSRITLVLPMKIYLLRLIVMLRPSQSGGQRTEWGPRAKIHFFNLHHHFAPSPVWRPTLSNPCHQRPHATEILVGFMIDWHRGWHGRTRINSAYSYSDSAMRTGDGERRSFPCWSILSVSSAVLGRGTTGKQWPINIKVIMGRRRCEACSSLVKVVSFW
jgi:hypothetical protein